MSLPTDLESCPENGSTTHESKVDETIVDWDGPDDPNNPQNWPRLKRNIHVVLISVFTMYGYVGLPLKAHEIDDALT